VKVSLDLTNQELLALLRHDSDPFNRWQASQTVAMRLLVGLAMGANVELGEIEDLASSLLAFIEADAARDPAFAALVLTLPNEADVAQEIAREVNPDAIYNARIEMRRRIGQHCTAGLRSLREELAASGPYSPDAASAGRRALRNIALDLIAGADPVLGAQLAVEQFENATNMTDRLGAFGVLTTIPGTAREQAITRFGERYRNEPLVLDKWFASQAAIPEPETLERVRHLMEHAAFSLTNPNRVRSLIGSFATLNQTQFNRSDGAGYDFLADLVLRLDDSNPQLAARLLTAFGSWRMMESARRARAEEALRRVGKKTNLSRDVGDIVQRSLGEGATS
jgi:aminopeptidase N